MKNARRIIVTAVACAVFPALALAAGPGGAAQSLAGQWLGPYAGAQFGFNNSSASGLDSEVGVGGGVLLGYNTFALLSGLAQPVVLGADFFGEFNGQEIHRAGTTYGSNVFGVDLLVGYPTGLRGRILPFLKFGFGALSATGDLGGSEVSPRIGLGAEYRLNPQLGLVAQWMHQDADHITNDNFTLGISYHFRVY